MRSIAALFRCTDVTVPWARSFVEMPDWLIGETYGYTSDQAHRIQEILADLLAEHEATK
jgi:hypothetical protein